MGKIKRLVLLFLLSSSLFPALALGREGEPPSTPANTRVAENPRVRKDQAPVIMTGNDAWSTDRGWMVFDGDNYVPVETRGGFWRAAGTMPPDIFYRHSDWRWPDGWQLSVFVGTTVKFCGPNKCIGGTVEDIFILSASEEKSTLGSCGTEMALIACEGTAELRRVYCVSSDTNPPGWGDW